MRQMKYGQLNKDNWKDFVELFGDKGACGGCWCMWWKLGRKEFEANKGAGNKKLQKEIVYSGTVPGIIVYVEGEPAGWCAVEPRQAYIKLQNSRILKPVDDKPVWSVVCFFVAKKYRRTGISVELLKEAVRHAARKGAGIVEGYPVDAKGTKPDAFIYYGTASAFRKAGFREVARRSESRPVMRIYSEKFAKSY